MTFDPSRVTMMPGYHIVRSDGGLVSMVLITGTPAADTLAGTSGADTISSLAGNDTITVSAGSDIIDGGDGTDQLLLADGAIGDFGLPPGNHRYILTSNRLSDASGTLNTTFSNIESVLFYDRSGANVSFDASSYLGTLRAIFEAGDHTLTGSDRADTFYVGLGNTSIDGRSGSDLAGFLAGPTASPITVRDSGDAIAITQAGQTITMRNIEIISISANLASTVGLTVDLSVNDSRPAFSIIATNKTDYIKGGAEYDTIQINGTATDQDTYIGGQGFDYFNIAGMTRIGLKGQIADFDSTDRLNFANSKLYDGIAPKFIGTAAFTGLAGEYRYRTANGQTFVEADTNGDAVADQVLTLSNGAFALYEESANTLTIAPVISSMTVTGTNFADTLVGGLGNDTVNALAGDDTITVSPGADTVDGGAGNDTLFFSLVSATPGLFTTTADRLLTIGTSTLSDGAGQFTTAFANVESVRLEAGKGFSDAATTIDARQFQGSGGIGVTDPSGKALTIIGSPFGDRFSAARGPIAIDGGDGFDSVTYALQGDATLSTTGGATVIAGSGFSSTLRNIEALTVSNTPGAVMDASALVTPLTFALTSNATAIGGSGADRFEIAQNPVAPTLRLTGGAGADTYVLQNVAGQATISITDFAPGDRISSFISFMTESRFIGRSAFSGQYQIRYDVVGQSTRIEFNASAVNQPTVVITIENGAFALVEYGANILGIAQSETVFGTPGDDSLIGTNRPDYIEGLAGNDTIDGRAGADTMVGGPGNDRYIVDDPGDVVIEGDFAGDDTIESSISFVLPLNVETLILTGSASINGTGTFSSKVIGNSGDNYLKGAGTLIGGGGNDTLAGSGRLEGGIGNDVYVVGYADIIEQPGEGFDTIYFQAEAGSFYFLKEDAEIEVLSTERNDGLETVSLTGSTYAQTIVGNYGRNFLAGRGGADTLIGLRGDDTYRIDSTDTVIRENAGEGTDTAIVTAAAGLTSYTLNADAQVEILSAEVGTAKINITGNGFSQIINGNDGANILSTGGGAPDTLNGGLGDDIYRVFSTGDVIEDSGGFDTVYASGTSYFLYSTASVEYLSTSEQAGTQGFYMVGNGASQVIVGNYGDNTINGRGGDGVLLPDTLIGLFGNDTYGVFSQGDVVREVEGQGTDVVYANASYQLRAGTSIEILSAVDQSATGAANAFTLRGNAFAQTVVGNGADNVIDGRGGNDTLIGLAGADVFAFTTALDGTNNVDTIRDFGNGADRIGLATDIFAGVTDGGIQAGEFVLGIAAGDADDRLVYDQATGRLWYDADGNGAGAQILFAQLAAGTALTAASFTPIAPVAELAAA